MTPIVADASTLDRLAINLQTPVLPKHNFIEWGVIVGEPHKLSLVYLQRSHEALGDVHLMTIAAERMS